jgi:phage terminase large subunit-like protein
MDDRTRAQIHSELALLSGEQLIGMNRRLEWLQTARPDQLPPEDYFVWMLMGGRGSGKTRAGAEDVWWPSFIQPQRIAVVGPTNNDVRKTCFEGESGLLARIPKELVVNYNRTSLELKTSTVDGGESLYFGYSAEEAERLRGPQHHRAWCDELGAWGKAGPDLWDNLLFGLRLGELPTIVVTTTPRTTPLIRTILADPSTVVSRATTYDNSAHLPASVLRKFKEKYEGTRLGRQELLAELLDEVTGAIWADEMLIHVDQVPENLSRIVVAVDPSGAGGGEESADEIGIVVVGVIDCGDDADEYYVLADRTVKGGPSAWGRAAVNAYEDFEADRMVAEVNFGGAMVESVIRTVDPEVSYKSVRASRGKVVRAEPVAALYEQGRVKHVKGLEKLEQQMMLMTNDGYVGDGSPDRVDALVWAITDLMGKRKRKETNLALREGKQNNEFARI